MPSPSPVLAPLDEEGAHRPPGVSPVASTATEAGGPRPPTVSARARATTPKPTRFKTRAIRPSCLLQDASEVPPQGLVERLGSFHIGQVGGLREDDQVGLR